MKNVPILWLDLDSTVRKGKDELGHFVNKPEDVVIFPEALTMMRRWRDVDDGRIVAVSNQGGIALGNVSYSDVMDVMDETGRQTYGLFDEIMWCPHHPESRVEGMARCWCRKPNIGMLVLMLEKLKEAYPLEAYPLSMMLFVGDRAEDWKCSQNAGIDFQWSWEWRSNANR